MIQLFIGQNDFLIKKEIGRWKKGYTQKFGEDNVYHIKFPTNISFSEMQEILFERSLFSTSRLVIIENMFSSKQKTDFGKSWGDVFIERLSEIDEEYFVLLAEDDIDKRTSSYKTLKKLAKIQEFNASDSNVSFKYFYSAYSSSIDYDALGEIIRLKNNNYTKIDSEIQKLLLVYSKIDITQVKKHIRDEFENSIFTFVDELLLKKASSLESFGKLLEGSNIYMLYSSVIANIRIFLYISYLKKTHKDAKTISSLLSLGNRSFLVGKQLQTSHKEIYNLYTSLINCEKKMKTGKLYDSGEDIFEKEIQRALLTFISV